MATAGGNQDLLFALGNKALGSVDHLVSYYSVQRRHPDGERWVDVAHFADRKDAKEAVRRAVEHGAAAEGDLRVEHVSHEPH
jgi:hypothetical protein